MDVQKNIIKKIQEFQSYLEKNAELSWQEHKTCEYIVSCLGPDFVWSEKTALIYAVGNGTEIFFRAELDGLPTSSGTEHMCGHAAHSASLMGAYLYFKQNPPREFRIYFIFQPSEEGYPSGAEFITRNFPRLAHCKIGFAFHAFPYPKEGTVLNPIIASGDYFEIVVTGKATHIKNKNNNEVADALLIASYIVQAINRKKSKAFIINVGVLKAGDAPNSIAAEAILQGDIRALSNQAQQKAYEWLVKTIEKYRVQQKINIQLSYHKAYPAYRNNPRMIRRVKKLLPVTGTIKTFATEDFSLYSPQKVFLLIGTGKKTELHETNFSVSTAVTEKILQYWITIGNNMPLLIP